MGTIEPLSIFFYTYMCNITIRKFYKSYVFAVLYLFIYELFQHIPYNQKENKRKCKEKTKRKIILSLQWFRFFFFYHSLKR